MPLTAVAIPESFPYIVTCLKQIMRPT